MEAVPDLSLAGRYVLEDLIATGGMAAVWRARDTVLDRLVAVKILHQHLAGNQTVAERFHREAVAAAALAHPHIIRVFDTGNQDGVPFIVMELFPCVSFRQVLEQTGLMEPRDAVAVMLPVLEALGFAHQHGVVHRDVKPANILLSDDGWAKVTDFGIAKAAFSGGDLTTTGVLLGTVRYVSPEQVEGRPVDGRSDLYSAGVTLYEALTGRPPFQAETDVATAMMRTTQDPLPPRAVRPGTPRALEAAVLRAMARNPEDRFPSAEAMHAALDRHGGRADPSATQAISPAADTDTAPHPVGSSTFRSWMLVPLVLVIIAAAAVGAGLAVGRLEIGGPLGVRGAPAETGPAQAVTRRIPIGDVRDFDPEGDGSEHPEDVRLVVDGEPATAWTTDHYETADFGQLKEGVGLWIGFAEEAGVTRVTIRSPIAGWSFQLLASSSPGDRSEPLASEDGQTTFTSDPSGRTVVVLRPVSTSGILIWITGLGPDEGRFGAAIAEVSVAGSTS